MIVVPRLSQFVTVKLVVIDFFFCLTFLAEFGVDCYRDPTQMKFATLLSGDNVLVAV